MQTPTVTEFKRQGQTLAQACANQAAANAARADHLAEITRHPDNRKAVHHA